MIFNSNTSKISLYNLYTKFNILLDFEIVEK